MDKAIKNQEAHFPLEATSIYDSTLESNLPASDSSDFEDLNKVRDILFGRQVRTIESKFSSLEEDIKKNIKNDFENFKNEVIESSTSSLESDLKRLSLRIDNIDTGIEKLKDDIHTQIADQSKKLSDEINQKYKEISEIFETKCQTIFQDKASRSEIIVLLNEMASRLGEGSDSSVRE
ncbi:conserved hypothetical protein [Candidatus Magnetomoraceae bacterium gMMP-1]